MSRVINNHMGHMYIEVSCLSETLKFQRYWNMQNWLIEELTNQIQKPKTHKMQKLPTNHIASHNIWNDNMDSNGDNGQIHWM